MDKDTIILLKDKKKILEDRPLKKILFWRTFSFFGSLYNEICTSNQFPGFPLCASGNILGVREDPSFYYFWFKAKLSIFAL